MNSFSGYGFLIDTLPERSPVAIALHAWGGSMPSERIEAAIVEIEAGGRSRAPTFALLRCNRRDWQLMLTATERARCDLALYAFRLAALSESRRVYFFSRRLPDEATSRHLRRRGIELLASPLLALGALTLVHGEPPVGCRPSTPSGRAQDAA